MSKVQAIKDAVVDIVLTDGYQNLSMSKVAKKAGVSQATIYLSYASKEEMLTAIYVEAHAMIEGQTKVSSGPGTDVESELKTMFRHYMRILLDHPKQALFMYTVNNTPSLIDANVFQEMMSRNQDIRELIEYGQKQGLIVQADFDYIVAFTFDAINSLMILNYTRGGTMTDQQIQRAIDMCWRAIKV